MWGYGMLSYLCCPIDRALSGSTTSGQSGPGSNGNEGVLFKTQVLPEPHHPIQGTSWENLTHLQRCSLCILQPQPTGFQRGSSLYIYMLEGRVFTNDPGDRRSILGGVIPKTLKMVHDTSLPNTQQYKVCVKGKVEQSRERSNALGVVAIKRGAFWSPLTMVANFIYLLCVPCNKSIEADTIKFLKITCKTLMTT